MHCETSEYHPPKGWCDTGVGRLAPVSQTVGFLFRTPMSKRYMLGKKGLSIAPVSCLAWSIFKVQKCHTPFWNNWDSGGTDIIAP